MRYLLTALLLVGALIPPATGAETGTIRGRVLNGATDEPQAGVEVTLSRGTGGSPEDAALQDDAPEIVERTTTGPDGRYEFEGLTSGDEHFYAIDGRYEDGIFSGGALRLPDDTAKPPVIDTTLRVWNTTTDPNSILITADRLFVVASENQVGVIESITIGNLSQEAYIGRGMGDDASSTEPRASVGFSLPPNATEGVAIIDSDINLPELLSTEYGFAATAAIPPGETKVTFSYSVDGDGGSYDLTRRALYPMVKMSIFAADPLEVTSNRLESRGDARVGGRDYEEWTTPEGLDAGDPVQVVVVADAGVPAGLLAGMGGVLALVIVLGAWPLLRMRRGRAAEPEVAEPDPSEQLLRDIALLDLKHERGELSYEEWSEQRAKLKDELLTYAGRGAGA